MMTFQLVQAQAVKCVLTFVCLSPILYKGSKDSDTRWSCCTFRLNCRKTQVTLIGIVLCIGAANDFAVFLYYLYSIVRYNLLAATYEFISEISKMSEEFVAPKITRRI